MDALKDFLIRAGLRFLDSYILLPLSILLVAVVVVLISYLFVWIKPIRWYVPGVVAFLMGVTASWQQIQATHDLEVRRMLITYIAATGAAYWWFGKREETRERKAKQQSINSEGATP